MGELVGEWLGRRVFGDTLGAAVIGVGLGAADGMQLVELHTIRQSNPHPWLQHTAAESSVAVHSRAPRASHSTAASRPVTARPLKEPVKGALKLSDCTALVHIES